MSEKVEQINPYGGDSRAKSEQVRDMFDNIAPAYDFMNSAMSFGLHKVWLRRAVRLASADAPARVLDLATGTGDVAVALARKLPDSHVVGLDLSEGMLKIAREKIGKTPYADRIELKQGDCLALPFEDARFDCVTIAYGVRNLEHLLEGYREMWRTLRPGGTLVVIELSTPSSKIVRPLYNFYAKRVIPLVGRLISKDRRAYTYLPESIAAVPQRSQMARLILDAGFSSAEFRSQSFGVCTIYTAVK